MSDFVGSPLNLNSPLSLDSSSSAINFDALQNDLTMEPIDIQDTNEQLKNQTQDFQLENLLSSSGLTSQGLISANPLLASVNVNIDQLLKIIENQEIQNEKMIMQYKLKQVLLDYLKAKQASATGTPTPQPNTTTITSSQLPFHNQANQLINSIDLSPFNNSILLPITPPVSPISSFENVPTIFTTEQLNISSLVNCNNDVSISCSPSSNLDLTDDESNFVDEKPMIESQQVIKQRKTSTAQQPTSSTPLEPASPSSSNSSQVKQSKRTAHLSAEFRYRTKLNDKITKLRNLVGPKSQLSKSGVLSKSIDLIVRLQKSNLRFKQENAQMKLMLSRICNTQMPFVLQNTNDSNVTL